MTYLVVRAALLSDLQGCVVGCTGQGVPGVGAIRGPQHKQVVAGRPEQQIVGLGVLQGLWWSPRWSKHQGALDTPSCAEHGGTIMLCCDAVAKT